MSLFIATPTCMSLLSLTQLLPLCCFCAAVRNGHIKRITDTDIQSSVLEIMSSNVNTTYITCPAAAQETLGIKLPFLVMIIKNMKKYFSFEVQVLDDKGIKRRFRASNYQVRCSSCPAEQGEMMTCLTVCRDCLCLEGCVSQCLLNYQLITTLIA